METKRPMSSFDDPPETEFRLSRLLMALAGLVVFIALLAAGLDLYYLGLDG